MPNENKVTSRWYLRLTNLFPSSVEVKKLKRLGGEYVWIYIELMILALNDPEFCLRHTGLEVCLAAEVALAIDEDEERVQTVLDVLSKGGLLRQFDEISFFLEPASVLSGGSDPTVRSRNRRKKGDNDNGDVACNTGDVACNAGDDSCNDSYNNINRQNQNNNNNQSILITTDRTSAVGRSKSRLIDHGVSASDLSLFFETKYRVVISEAELAELLNVFESPVLWWAMENSYQHAKKDRKLYFNRILENKRNDGCFTLVNLAIREAASQDIQKAMIDKYGGIKQAVDNANNEPF